MYMYMYNNLCCFRHENVISSDCWSLQSNHRDTFSPCTVHVHVYLVTTILNVNSTCTIVHVHYPTSCEKLSLNYMYDMIIMSSSLLYLSVYSSCLTYFLHSFELLLSVMASIKHLSSGTTTSLARWCTRTQVL